MHSLRISGGLPRNIYLCGNKSNCQRWLNFNVSVSDEAEPDNYNLQRIRGSTLGQSAPSLTANSVVSNYLLIHQHYVGPKDSLVSG